MTTAPTAAVASPVDFDTYGDYVTAPPKDAAVGEWRRAAYPFRGRLNPKRIVPAGPVLDWDAPHGRAAPTDSR